MARRQSLIRARRMRRAMAAGGENSVVTGQILETIVGQADGSTITTAFGTSITFINVTGGNSLGTSYENLSGSQVTYQPPPGTATVIYECDFQVSGDPDAHNICHTRFYVDGVEIDNGRRTWGGEDLGIMCKFMFPIRITGTTNNTTGTRESWDSPLEMKLQIREYGGSNEQTYNRTNYWNGSGTNIVVRPIIKITAIG